MNRNFNRILFVAWNGLLAIGVVAGLNVDAPPLVDRVSPSVSAMVLMIQREPIASFGFFLMAAYFVTKARGPIQRWWQGLGNRE